MCKACMERYRMVARCTGGVKGLQRGMEWLLVTIDLVGDNWEFK